MSGAGFQREVPVRFGATDPAGIVYYPFVFDICHHVFEDFFQDRIGRNYASLLTSERTGFPTVHVEADFLAPIRYGERLFVTMSALRIGSSSLTLCFDGVLEDGRAAFRAKIVKSAASLDTFRALPIPEFLRPHFEAILSVDGARSGSEDPKGQ
ncbi:MAG: acyl-CoA thioesterase [Planctomycetota bacterium]